MDSSKSESEFPIFSFNYTSLTMPEDYCEANSSGPTLYAKDSQRKVREISIPLLFNQYDDSVSETFYDPLSDEIVSKERTTTSNLEEILGERNSTKREFDIDSFYSCMAQRLLSGDTDNHESQFAVDEGGRFYTFDFEYAGEPLNEVFANGISWTRSTLYQLNGEQSLSASDRETERENIGDELEAKGRDIAQELNIQKFEDALQEHPQIRYDRENREVANSDFDIGQLISNIEEMRSENPKLPRKPDWYWENRKEELPDNRTK